MTFFTSLHLLNLKQSEFLHTVDVDCVKLNEKYNCPHDQYSSAKSEYFQSRCSKCDHQWTVKKNIKYLDKLIRKYKCLFLSWDFNQPLILFFSNGSVVNMEFNAEKNTLLKVDIDNNLCGKFLPSRIVDVAMCKNCIYVTYTEPKLTLIHMNKDSPSLLAKIFGRKRGKLVGFEPKIVHFDLFVHSTKSLERKLSLNIQRDLLLVWWRNSGDDVWPWTPIAYLTDRVNMLVYSVNGPFIELLCPVKVQDELLHATFSKQHSNQFFALEEIKKEGEVVVNICFHEIIHGQCHLVCTIKLPLRGNLIAFDWSSTEDKLLAADSDGLLLIYDVKKKSTIATNLEFIPKHLSWHPQNCIALIVCRNNNLLCFDTALNIISFKLCYKTSLQSKFLELRSYFHNQFSVQKVLWQKSAFNDTCLLLLDSELSSFIFLKFSFGCITRHNVTALEIISQYLKYNSLDEAILLLRSLDWCSKNDIKFQCLSKIANCLFRKPLNFHTQAGLELALGTFYDWVEILPKRIVEIYENRMHHLARRFFHHLLRYHKFRKAFLLAVDLESQDLFLDLYHVAKQKGENILAAVALHKAEEFDDSSDSCSESCPSDSQSESSTSSGNEIPYIDILHQNISKNVLSWSVKDPENAHNSIKPRSDQTSQDRELQQSSSNSFRHNSYNSRENFSIKGSVYSNYPAVCHYETESHSNSSVIHHLPEHSSTIPNRYKKEPCFSNHSCNMFNSKSKICDKHNATGIKHVRENCVIEEENEEMDGTKIKLAHLGVI